MTILVDTDVLLDVALDRLPYAGAAANLVDALQSGHARGFVAWHTISNFYYLARPKRGTAEARHFLSDLLMFMEVAPASTAIARHAVQLAMADFEDAMQAAAAVACGASYIATRNRRDFHRSPVAALAPAALLPRLR